MTPLWSANTKLVPNRLPDSLRRGGFGDLRWVTSVLQIRGVARKGRIRWSRPAVTAITVLAWECVHSRAREEKKAVRCPAQPAISLLRLTPTRPMRFFVGKRIPTSHRDRLPFGRQCFPASFRRCGASATIPGPSGAPAFSPACDHHSFRSFRSCVCPSRAISWRG